MAMLLLRENGTVTICHSKTQDMKEITRQADILVVAIGKPKFVDETYVKEGAVVIDVGSIEMRRISFVVMLTLTKLHHIKCNYSGSRWRRSYDNCHADE